MRMILDSNVWTYVVIQDEVERLEKIEGEGRVQIVVPPSILIEVSRTSEVSLRFRLVKALTSRGLNRVHPPTEAQRLADELVREARRLRRPWLYSFPEKSEVARLEKWWKKDIWQAASRDPETFGDVFLGSDMESADSAILEVLAENRESVQASPLRPPEREPWIDLRDQPEAVRLGWDGERVDLWRVTSSFLWWEVIISRPAKAPGHADLRDWLEPFLIRGQVQRDREGWNRFWYSEVDAKQMPRTWLTEVLLAFQPRQKLTSGSPRDVQHAPYLFDADIFVTADRRYGTALETLRRWAPVGYAAVSLLPGDKVSSPLDAIEQILDA
jgi:hypothetical protein